MDEQRPATLAQLVDVTRAAAAQHPNPINQLAAALTTAATSSADLHLIIGSLLQANPR